MAQSAKPTTELDLWWGSYSPWAMIPSLVVCIALTVLLYWITVQWVPQRGWLQLTFSGLAGLLWLLQLARMAQRCFTYNYRLTNKYVYVDRGFWPLDARRLELKSVNRVSIKKDPWVGWLGIGDVQLWPADQTISPLLLRAIPGPPRIAETIRTAIEKVRLEPQST